MKVVSAGHVKRSVKYSAAGNKKEKGKRKRLLLLLGGALTSRLPVCLVKRNEKQAKENAAPMDTDKSKAPARQ